MRGRAMLRLESKTGWWLVTHVDHAHLAGAFAEKWGNDLFVAPEPREQVLHGITAHDDGWAARDQQPPLPRQVQFQEELKTRLAVDKHLAPEETSPKRIENHFRLLQACDYLSLLSCV